MPPSPLPRLLTFIAFAASVAFGPMPVSRADEIQTHQVESEYQQGTTEIRVILPESYAATAKYRVVYILPVEAGTLRKYGDPLAIFQQQQIATKENVIVVNPSFTVEPWFGDHATDPLVRQASYMKEFLVPWVEKRYSTPGTPEGRLLFGFSKSGWGAWSLLLKYPDFFGKAASWDAPLMFDDLHYHMAEVYGTRARLAEFQPSLLVEKQAEALRAKPRLVLFGEKDWGRSIPAPGGGSHTVEMHELLEKNHIPHHYDDTVVVPHRWDERWMLPMLRALLSLGAE